MRVKLVQNATIAVAALAVFSTAAACSSNAKKDSGSSSSSSSSASDTASSSPSDTASSTDTAASTAAASTTAVAGGGGGGAVKGAKIAFLMPDNGSTRYELHDHPGFVAQMKKDCPTCQVIYNNAGADATKQQNQFNSALTQGAKVIVLDPVDSAAAKALVSQAQAKGVKVIAYDRPIPTAKPDYYVSFDNETIGKLIAQSLVKKLKTGTIPSGSGILEVNGSPTDAAAGLIKKGIHEGLAGSGIKTLAEYDTPDWDPAKAQTWVSGQISQHKGKIVGVVAANDGTGGGAIAAFKAAGGAAVPPVTGNDATSAGLQLIINGDQYNTISKPSEIVAAAAADAAYQLASGKTPAAKTTVFGASSQLFVPLVITQSNLKAEIIDKKLDTAAKLCTSAYKAACTKLGIS